jgi:hypothetical protein
MAAKPIQPKQFAMPIAVEQSKAELKPITRIQMTSLFRLRK